MSVPDSQVREHVDPESGAVFRVDGDRMTVTFSVSIRHPLIPAKSGRSMLFAQESMRFSLGRKLFGREAFCCVTVNAGFPDSARRSP